MGQHGFARVEGSQFSNSFGQSWTRFWSAHSNYFKACRHPTCRCFSQSLPFILFILPLVLITHGRFICRQLVFQDGWSPKKQQFGSKKDQQGKPQGKKAQPQRQKPQAQHRLPMHHRRAIRLQLSSNGLLASMAWSINVVTNSIISSFSSSACQPLSASRSSRACNRPLTFCLILLSTVSTISQTLQTGSIAEAVNLRLGWSVWLPGLLSFCNNS